MANVSAKSSGDPAFHKAFWKTLMDGVGEPVGDESGGDGGSCTSTSPTGDGKG